MKPWSHFILGGLVSTLPDVPLLLYGWRKDWVPETHPLVRLTRFLHTWKGLLLILGLAYVSHLLADAFSSHNTKETWNAKDRSRLFWWLG